MVTVDQLVEFYYKYDKFQTGYVAPERAIKIYSRLLDAGRIHAYSLGPNLIGYGESIRMTYDTLGRIICGANIYDMLDELDLNSGNVAYMANVTIHPDHRGSSALRYLRNDFFLKNYSCKYFVGHALRKRHQPVKVFKRSEAMKKWVKEVS